MPRSATVLGPDVVPGRLGAAVTDICDRPGRPGTGDERRRNERGGHRLR